MPIYSFLHCNVLELRVLRLRGNELRFIEASVASSSAVRLVAWRYPLN
jgi:hypothetical protein